MPACANVITDWDDKALVLVTPMTAVGATSPYMAQRMMAMVHAAMFDAVNSIEQARCRSSSGIGLSMPWDAISSSRGKPRASRTWCRHSRDAAGDILVNGGNVPISGGAATVANTGLISVSGQGGNDVTVDESNGALPPAIMAGDDGNDTDHRRPGPRRYLRRRRQRRGARRTPQRHGGARRG